MDEKRLITLEIKALLKAMSDDVYCATTKYIGADNMGKEISKLRRAIACYMSRIDELVKELPTEEDDDLV